MALVDEFLCAADRAGDFDLGLEVVVGFTDPIGGSPEPHAALAAIEVAGFVIAMLTLFNRERSTALSAGHRDLFFAILARRATIRAKSTLAVTGFNMTLEGFKRLVALLTVDSHFGIPLLDWGAGDGIKARRQRTGS